MTRTASGDRSPALASCCGCGLDVAHAYAGHQHGLPSSTVTRARDLLWSSDGTLSGVLDGDRALAPRTGFEPHPPIHRSLLTNGHGGRGRLRKTVNRKCRIQFARTHASCGAIEVGRLKVGPAGWSVWRRPRWATRVLSRL